MTEWLKMVIEAEGYEVRTALIGTRGEEIFKQWRPDVVVTDLMLPDLDGIALLRRLKEIDPWPEIIIISGQGTLARAVEAGQAGAFFFLEKPVSQDGLMNMIRRAIDQHAGDAPSISSSRNRSAASTASRTSSGRARR